MGPYDNETNEYLNLPGYMEGHWYVDGDNNLYIVPNGEAEIEGPEGPTEAALSKLYRGKPFAAVDPEDVARELGLTTVLGILRRFSPDIGFYYA